MLDLPPEATTEMLQDGVQEITQHVKRTLRNMTS